jgi:hypothetical protein
MSIILFRDEFICSYGFARALNERLDNNKEKNILDI